MGNSNIDMTYLKESINNFVWCNAPGNTTLDRAECLATEIFMKFEALQVEKEKENEDT